ncbi:hypothetical protein EVAR_28496_1 [Eumeta japonica]|uniref:Uncharacterized protein n=1 Tax=Eumeta variegata TaxID=151549 RepID=A0A4C1WSR7_EUMVA|nr:hypothetical protein EVAR_28496_1 [Eumeta japonica]
MLTLYADDSSYFTSSRRSDLAARKCSQSLVCCPSGWISGSWLSMSLPPDLCCTGLVRPMIRAAVLETKYPKNFVLRNIAGAAGRKLNTGAAAERRELPDPMTRYGNAPHEKKPGFESKAHARTCSRKQMQNSHDDGR